MQIHPLWRHCTHKHGLETKPKPPLCHTTSGAQIDLVPHRPVGKWQDSPQGPTLMGPAFAVYTGEEAFSIDKGVTAVSLRDLAGQRMQPHPERHSPWTQA